ncbi:MAG TPA: S53 family peptidase [Ktedonobacterales bacterium]|jgi:subtilase family serine protease
MTFSSEAGPGKDQTATDAPLDDSPVQEQPPAKPNTRLLFLLLGGLALLVIFTPLALTLAQRPAPAPIAQTTPAASPTPAPTPTETPPAYTPAGTAPTSAQCQSLIHAPCYSPEQMQQAFRLTPLYRQGYDGRGQTIVILGTGKTTTLAADLHQFDLAWGLPDPTFTILHPFGPPAPYTCAGGMDDLQLENTLDVEWSHAMAPGASIILLIGSNDSGGPRSANCAYAGLLDALAYAVDQHLGSVISISYGGSELGDISESASEKAQDRRFFNQAHALFERAAKAGITVLASSGDDGATNFNSFSNPSSVWDHPNISWPASDPAVLAVGGTSLALADANGLYGSETVWNAGGGSTGGGLSAVFQEPDYQHAIPDQTVLHGKRGIPDISFPAAVNYALYGSFLIGELGAHRSQWSHWDIIGGTSASAPCWAGLIAIANQMRGKPLGLVQPALYSLIGREMHDIITGDNSLHGVTGYQARPGYDLASGWGTPIADTFLPALIQAADLLAAGCPNRYRACP